MSRRAHVLTFAFALVASVSSATTLHSAIPSAKWPPWLSIEAPLNPFDPATHGVLLLVHGAMREGVPQLADLSGSAEGYVNGARRSIDLHFDPTAQPGVFALRKQWPSEGSWMLRISLRTTTALVTLDRDGRVAVARVPTEHQGKAEIPRAVARREIDSTLATMASAVATR